MRKFKEITDYMDKFCPPHLAFDGDNVGLIVGSAEKTVSKVMLSLDVDEHVVSEAVSLNADAIISHHPLMFHAIKRLSPTDPMQKTLIHLVSNDIPLFSAHTNLDCVHGGLNDFLAEKLGIKDTKVIQVVLSENSVQHGFGRIGQVPDGTTLSDMLNLCMSALGTTFVKYVGDKDKKIKTVAINCGGGADAIDDALSLGADLFITGDVKYNPGRDCYDNGMALIDAGHYETEHIVCELLKNTLSKEFPDIDFVISESNVPVFNIYYR